MAIICLEHVPGDFVRRKGVVDDITAAIAFFLPLVK